MNARLSLANGLRLGAAGLTVALLSACGGHSGSGTLPSTRNSGAATAAVKFHIVVPKAAAKAPSAAARRPNYISPSTATARIDVAPAGGGTTTTATATCTTTCDGTINAPIGSDIFTVSLYSDGSEVTPVVPQLLSQGTKTQTVVAGIANSVSLTFNPVVAAVTFLPASFTLGTASDSTITVAAQDAAGNDIVGPGSFIDAAGNLLTISAAIVDPSVALVAPAGVTQPGGTIPVHYSGTVPFFAGTVTPTVTGGTVANLYRSADAIVSVAGTGALTTLAATGAPVGIALDPTTPGKYWYAARSGSANWTSGGASTTVAGLPFPLYVAADAATNLWFTDWGADAQLPAPAAIYRVKASDSTVAPFPLPSPYTSAAPTSIIVSGDAAWFTLRGWGNGGVRPAGTLESAIGKLSPLSGSPTFSFYPVNGNPYGLTVGPLGKIWYTEDWGNKVGVLDPTLATTQPQVDYNLGDGTPFADAAKGIASDGTLLWVCRQASAQIAKVDAAGAATYYQLPYGSDPKNVIYVANFAGAGPRVVFTESNSAKIGILDPATATAVEAPSYVWPFTAGLTEIALPAGTVPVGLIYDASALWVTDSGSTSHILKITAF